MCLITYAPKGADALDWETLDYSRSHMNDDGFGLAWYDEATGQWEAMRSLRASKLSAAVKIVPPSAPLVIHQRYRTHGAISLDNCHPYEVVPGVLLFHNGTISGTRADFTYSEKGEDGKYQSRRKYDCSDTLAYCEDELAPVIEAAGWDWLHDPKGVQAIKNRIGSGNVLAICLPDCPEPVLVNEKRGDWEGGLYYSNGYSRPFSGVNGSGYGSYYGRACGEVISYDWEQYDGNGDKKSTAISSTTNTALSPQSQNAIAIYRAKKAREKAEAEAASAEAALKYGWEKGEDGIWRNKNENASDTASKPKSAEQSAAILLPDKTSSGTIVRAARLSISAAEQQARHEWGDMDDEEAASALHEHLKSNREAAKAACNACQYSEYCQCGLDDCVFLGDSDEAKAARELAVKVRTEADLDNDWEAYMENERAVFQRAKEARKA